MYSQETSGQHYIAHHTDVEFITNNNEGPVQTAKIATKDLTKVSSNIIFISITAVNSVSCTLTYYQYPYLT